MSAEIRVGTCAWVEKGLIADWYPKTATTAEARLRYYAEHYDTVEVDSSYYAIPQERVVANWAARTPPGFVFHIKAFGLMTGHRVRPEQLPGDLRSARPWSARAPPRSTWRGRRRAGARRRGRRG